MPSLARPTRAPARPLLFLDFEASSLSAGSWPVEIGYAWFADGRVETRALVIAPRPDWSMADWSETSARVHGIGLGQIRAGVPAAAVAAETDAFAHFDVVSDNPTWEQRWLDRLREGRSPRIDVMGLRDAMRGRLDDAASGEVVRALLRTPAPHRTAPRRFRRCAACPGLDGGDPGLRDGCLNPQRRKRAASSTWPDHRNWSTTCTSSSR